MTLQVTSASRMPRGPRVAIVGGGITGLTSAFYLQRAGCEVVVYEAGASVGGLSTSFNYGPFEWDRFYHCILTSDSSLLGLIEDLDLSSNVRWTHTEVGFYSQGALYKMTRPVDLLRFPHLSLLDKLRFALGTIYAGKFCNGEGLEGVPLRSWIERVFGKALYREMWAPLLQCKLGAMQERASAAFLWATLKRLYSTREQNSSQQEKLGFVQGGYKRILGRLSDAVAGGGADIRLQAQVRRIDSDGDGVVVQQDGRRERFDSAILTVPGRIAAAMCPGFGTEYTKRLHSIEYLAIVCCVVVLRRPLSEFYVTNITDKVKFTGVIEMTNLIGTDITQGFSLVYLPKYTSASDPLFQQSDEEVWEAFHSDLCRIHPCLRTTDIEGHFVFRERYVQPVPTLDYSQHMPGMETPLAGVYLANTSQILNDTLNNNAMTRIAREACRMVLEIKAKTIPITEGLAAAGSMTDASLEMVHSASGD